MKRKQKPGDWLVECAETGVVDFASRMRKRWDGLYVREIAYEPKHPQYLLHRRKEEIVGIIREITPTTIAEVVSPVFVGLTNVPAPQGAAYHLYDLAIPDMEIGRTFIVR